MRAVQRAALAFLALAFPVGVVAQRPDAGGNSRFSLTVMRSWDAQSVSPREPIDAALTTVTAQLTHPLGYWAGLHWSYVADVTPAIVLRTGASDDRLRQIGPFLRPLYTVRRGFGAGVAPLGVQVTRTILPHTRLLAEVTGGGAWYSTILPYGDDGTRANFTASPRVLLEHDREGFGALAVGYSLHHISNGGFGRANPGINARMIVVRWTRTLHTP